MKATQLLNCYPTKSVSCVGLVKQVLYPAVLSFGSCMLTKNVSLLAKVPVIDLLPLSFEFILFARALSIFVSFTPGIEILLVEGAGKAHQEQRVLLLGSCVLACRLFLQLWHVL